MKSYEERLDDFIQNLKSKNFYDAHEDLEALWFPKRFENSDEARVLKGFINAAVSFELQKKGKAEAAKKVWQNYMKYRVLLDSLDSCHLKKYLEIAQEIEKLNKVIGTISL